MSDRLLIKRTSTPSNPPASGSLQPGELAVEMANPVGPRLWCGVPTSVDATGRRMIVDPAAAGSGGISDAPSDGSTYGRLNATWTQVLPITGGTLTGGLTITPSSGVGNQITVNGIAVGTSLIQNKAAGFANNHLGQVGGLNRWNVILGNNAAESGGNAGSDFALSRYTDAGALIDTPLVVSRATGNVTLASSSGNTGIFLNKASSGVASVVTGMMGGLNRWQIVLGGGSAETGGNTGSDFVLWRMQDSGATIDQALTISRATGVVTLPSSGGLLQIAPPTPTSGSNNTQITLSARDTNLAATGGVNYFTGYRNGSIRWSMYLGDGGAESGSNAGSNFAINRYSDAGAYLGQSIAITRSGVIFLSDNVQVTYPTVTIAPSNAGGGIALYKVTGAYQCAITGIMQGAGTRWSVVIGDTSTESGSNAGSNFQIQRYADNGAYIDTTFMINRASGQVSINGPPGLLIAAPAGANDATLVLSKPASGRSNLIYGYTGGSARWSVNFGGASAESGSNTGSDFIIARFNDAGAAVDQPVTVSRQTGQVSFNAKPAGYSVPGQLSGLSMVKNSGNQYCLDIAPGGATSDDNTWGMVLSATWTKNVTGPFAAGNGTTFGCLDTGSVAASTFYHVFLIFNPISNVADVLFSLSATAPTMPSGYTKKRRIGSIRTNTGSQITPFVQLGDHFTWIDSRSWDYANVGLNATMSVTGCPMVPPGVRVIAKIISIASSAFGQLQFNSTDDPNAAMTAWNQSGNNGNQMEVLTDVNTTFLLGAAVAQSAGFYMKTTGYIDNRGK